MRLGIFGEAAAEPVEPDTFGWFGQELRVNPLAGDTTFVDFIEEYGEVDEKDPKAIVGTKKFLREIVHPDDFDVFWRLGRENGRTLQDFAEVAMQIIEGLVDRPTARSSDSSPGPSTIVENSMDDSYSRVIREHEQQGRPDLAVVYLHAQRAQAARRAG